ncbi:MAG: GNAT family N-acetyltransferase [Caldilineaceae bacterium]|nr:GNAT family N-acetyltransferase [Caldilineaceae bacterium]
MIRLLTEADRAQADTLLAAAPQLTLYMLGNLEKLGFTEPICEFWGDFAPTTPEASLRAVLNRYLTGWTVYGTADANWPGLAAIVDQHPAGAERLQDNPGGVDSFLPYLQRYRASKDEREEIMVLAAAHFQPIAAPAGVVVRRGTLADLPKLVAFYADAGHMSRSAVGVERPLRDTRLWLAEEAGTLLATALTNAETSALAMIGGVYTQPVARGRGLSQAVCSALCADLLADQKQPILYWNTPAAGVVYRKLGFSATGQWRSVWLHSY